jgi:hypothetical protein
VLAAMGPSVSKGSGEQSLARTLWPRLEDGWLLSADRLFYNWADWCAASDSGADLLWRVKDDLRLPYLELLPDGSYRSGAYRSTQGRKMVVIALEHSAWHAPSGAHREPRGRVRAVRPADAGARPGDRAGCRDVLRS